MRLAKDNVEYAGAYHTFKGSPVSEGLFQHDLHSLYNNGVNYTSGRHDWDTLRANVMRYGTRNSLGLCCQPTASTAQILGNNECIEPYVTNIYNRKVISGTFQIVNKHLIRDLTAMGLWNTNMKNTLIASRGSVQSIMEIPKDIRDRYLTVWEIKQRELIQMSADRGRFIDQSQSLNLFLANPTPEQLRAMHLHSWKSGLKTGMYYLRSQPATHAQQFTVAVASKHETPKQEATVYTDEEKLICSRDNKESCLACS
jgi:ribonucleoside-diphosphate reductase alpha chain